MKVPDVGISAKTRIRMRLALNCGPIVGMDLDSPEVDEVVVRTVHQLLLDCAEPMEEGTPWHDAYVDALTTEVFGVLVEVSSIAGSP